MIEKVIRVLKDFELKTIYGFHLLVEGEVKRIRFKNQRSFNTLLTFGNFIEAKRGEKESKNIPVILPVANENTIVAVEPTEKLDPAEKLDPEAPWHEETPEFAGKALKEETAVVKESIIIEGAGVNEVKEERDSNQRGVSLDEAGEPMEQCTPEDLRQSEPPIEELAVEELTPEQETEGLSKVEVTEIDIKKVETKVEVKDELIQRPIDVIDRV